MRFIPLGGKRGQLKIAIVDNEDYELVKDLTWHVNPDGYAQNNRQSMHRLILSPPPGMVVDHINHNRLDNRRSNLRAATPQQNSVHRLAPTTHVYRGVQRAGHGQYRAVIRGKSLGRYPTKEAAAQAYNAAALTLWGDFAVLNEVSAA